MKQSLGFNSIALGGAAALIAIQPALAAPVQVTGVQLNRTASGVNVTLQTQSGSRPQVFAVNRGNSWTADLPSSQLRLTSGKNFRQDNPAPGIASVTVAPLSATSVRVTVVGKSGAPVGQVVRPDKGGVLLSVSPFGTQQAAAPTPIAAGAGAAAASARSYSVIAQPPASAAGLAPTTAPIAVPLPEKPVALAPAPTNRVPVSSRTVISQAPVTPTPVAPAPITPAPVTPAPVTPAPVAPAPVPASPTAVPTNRTAPLLPNPEIQVRDASGALVPPGVVGVAPRAVPPPAGDIATAQVDASGTTIDLGSAERVPRLVLRDAPAREVLGLLARAAGLNLAFVGDLLTQGQPGQPAPAAAGQAGATAASEGPRITLDVENEPVQNVFNYVLQITGLEANRVGRTVFVGPKLPNTARNLVVRSVRLNQASITTAINFLVTLGAESAVSRDRLVTNAVATPVGTLAGGAGGSAITQTQTATESRIENQRVEYQDSTPLLRGLQISGDERTNQVTLVGEPKKVGIAIAQLAQLDIRRRQVTVNVRVVDVDLLSSDQFSANSSFGIIDNTRAVLDAGTAVVNFGRTAPADTGLGSGLNTLGSAVGAGLGGPFNFARNFLLQLQASISSGNAKILTDPTLLVQEGQTATVNVTQEVITNITQQTTASENSTQTTITVEKGRAGLILPIKVDRIDDNGFVSLSIAPSVSRIGDVRNVNLQGSVNAINLLNERRLESGQVRLRDGQTLLLTGIIQDEDRADVTKVPILGDIPILGALFRRTNRTNQRREVIVIVTPRVLDDSQQATFGYGYSPGPTVRQVLDGNNGNRQ
ncbi:AMIN domain-containing protein [Phormidium sp. FACHB-592]|uniref:AMIN domain-containing protein n=1 Tax=Stenomitos frigidus AS-A4 TaxID=2933935 RepID=A0ABV0KG73_9CYAN|nr:AMIN domain-containing protein [Phormidium sp. FACHB-592]